MGCGPIWPWFVGFFPFFLAVVGGYLVRLLLIFFFCPTVDVDVDVVGVVGGCGGFSSSFFSAGVCGCGGSGWWLVAAMVGGCGGCGLRGWMRWLAVLRIIGLRKRETKEREGKIINNKVRIFK